MLKKSLILLVTTVVSNLLIATHTYADSTLCSGYSFSSCINAGYTAHGFENHYTNSYWNAYSGHNCTNYVGYMLTQNGDSGPGVAMGVAGQWDNTIRNNQHWSYTVDNTPTRGSIALWDENFPSKPSGHVAYVEEVIDETTIKVSEDNYPSGPFRWREINTSGDWPDKFLHIADAATGSSTPGITRMVSGNLWWHLRNHNSSGSADASFSYGITGDKPVSGDWDDNGTDTIGVTRATGGALWWHLRNNNTSGSADYSFSYGLPTDIPVVGDWDGNGTMTPGIVRVVGSSLWWHLRNSNTAGAADESRKCPLEAGCAILRVNLTRMEL